MDKEQMTEKARAAARAYKKEWRAKNRDKVHASNVRYWNKRAEEASRQEEQKA